MTQQPISKQRERRRKVDFQNLCIKTAAIVYFPHTTVDLYMLIVIFVYFMWKEKIEVEQSFLPGRNHSYISQMGYSNPDLQQAYVNFAICKHTRNAIFV